MAFSERCLEVLQRIASLSPSEKTQKYLFIFYSVGNETSSFILDQKKIHNYRSIFRINLQKHKSTCIHTLTSTSGSGRGTSVITVKKTTQTTG